MRKNASDSPDKDFDQVDQKNDVVDAEAGKPMVEFLLCEVKKYIFHL